MAKNESSENYLEAILMLSKKLPVVRSVDIANELGFKKSSVSIAMKKLRQENHITVTDAGFIYLTDSGKEIANMIYERHEFISKWPIMISHDGISSGCVFHGQNAIFLSKKLYTVILSIISILCQSFNTLIEYTSDRLL